MSLGYLTATKQLIVLHPLRLEFAAVDGVPVGTLSGREYAAMATGRVMRAAQSHFEMPSEASVTHARMARGARTEAIDGALQRKTISAFEDDDTKLLRLLYREVVVRFKPETSMRRRTLILKTVGLRQRCCNAMVADQIVAFDFHRKLDGPALVQAARTLAELDEVAFATPNFVSQFKRGATPATAGAPSSKQWHLRIVRATQAWKTTRGKRAVTIAILDDGVDIAHPELRPNLRRNPDRREPRDKFGRDFFLSDRDPDHFNPQPKRYRAPFDSMNGNDIHGTPCAGVAAGRGPGAYGLAPDCRILPVKIFHADDLASDANVADAIRYAAMHADILSCSWTASRSPDIEFALRDAQTLGRKGRGAIIVCATGNDARTKVGFPASDPNAIGVGASTDGDSVASYSNRGAQVWVVAPSSGGDRSIVTTDVGAPGRGFNTGNADAGGKDGLLTNDFGGTSSATPLVAGLCGLLLAMKPTIELAEVRRILAGSAKKIGPASSYDVDGHSPLYGHGRIDAAAAVALLARQLAASTGTTRMRNTTVARNEASLAPRADARPWRR